MSAPAVAQSPEQSSGAEASRGGTLKDLQRLTSRASGDIAIPAGRYLLTETWDIDLSETGAVSLRALGPVTLVMASPGPAIRIRGEIRGTANPDQFRRRDWLQRMPLIDGLEIIGEHPQADGIELRRTMQATISRVNVRRARHAVRLADRNRNVIISDCHLYDNSGVGLLLDEVNLHQINVNGSHISYNRGGGIVVRGGNVRNLHVTGCDIEANMSDDGSPTTAANILVDQSADGSAAEIAITGCTIQHSAHYGRTPRAPGGANIRILGRDDFQPNMITITGNILSDTETHIHLRHVTDVAISGNTFFTTEPTDLLIERSSRVTVAASVFNPRESSGTGQIVLRDSRECLLTGLTMRDLRAGRAAVSMTDCHDCRIGDCIISGSRNGVWMSDCESCVMTDCTVTRLLEDGRPLVKKSSDGSADVSGADL